MEDSGEELRYREGPDVPRRPDGLHTQGGTVGKVSLLTVIAAAFGRMIAVAMLIAFVAVITAAPLMLVLGALHASEGLSFVPALSFFQTLGSLFAIGVIGRAFTPQTTIKKEN